MITFRLIKKKDENVLEFFKWLDKINLLAKKTSAKKFLS